MCMCVLIVFSRLEGSRVERRNRCMKLVDFVVDLAVDFPSGERVSWTISHAEVCFLGRAPAL